MGLSSYFKAGKPDTKQKSALAPPAEGILERKSSAKAPKSHGGPLLPTPRDMSSGNSVHSIRSNNSSMFLDDIKHEVMVNYLYQQQCSHLWVSDGSGEIEGVLLRKSRGRYMACPPQLGDSPFAVACSALNVQVWYTTRICRRDVFADKGCSAQ